MYYNLARQKRMPKTSVKSSPKDTKCLYCGKRCTSKGVYEHERHHCKTNPHRKKRSFGKLQCHVCGQMYHAAGLRTHMAVQHPLEFAKEKRKRPSSKAAMRRRVARAESEERQQRQEVSRSPSPPRRSSSHATASPHDKKHRHNTASEAMAQIQREMQRAAN
jgi:hypothetical protein